MSAVAVVLIVIAAVIVIAVLAVTLRRGRERRLDDRRQIATEHREEADTHRLGAEKEKAAADEQAARARREAAEAEERSRAAEREQETARARPSTPQRSTRTRSHRDVEHACHEPRGRGPRRSGPAASSRTSRSRKSACRVGHGSVRRGAQRQLRVDAQAAREVDEREQRLAEPGLGGVAELRVADPLVRLGSLEAGGGGPALDLARVEQGGQVLGHVGERLVRSPPSSSRLIRSQLRSTSPALSRPRASPNTCGWRRISFSDIALGDLGEAARAALLEQQGQEVDLEQDVAELVERASRRRRCAAASASS